jgi:apolipoprotein D and lipocalin family protein
MKQILGILLFLIVGCTEKSIRSSEAPLASVERIELSRYLGKWFEIASRPNRFQKDCVATTATYSLDPEGEISIINECLDKTLTGKVRSAKGRAWPVDETNSKLKVSFFWPFKGDYWILEIGRNYEYSVIGEPAGKYIWILSRQPKMDEQILQGIFARLKLRGYSVEAISRTLQP